MRQLHLLFNCTEALREALRWARPEDALLLIGDASYALIDELAAAQLRSTNATLLVLASDVQCRGMSNRVPPHVTSLDDSDWLALCAQYDSIKSWY